jgi:hypothetical protein
MTILAQTEAPTGQGMLDLVHKLVSFQFPVRVDLLSAMESLSVIQAVGMIALGLLYLIYGLRFVKFLVVLNAAGLGAMIGMSLGTSMSDSPNMPPLMALAGAILLGALTWPMLHVAVGIMGALAGGLMGYVFWAIIAVALKNNDLLNYSWAGGLIGMVAIGMLTFIVFPVTVMIFTSVQGALMFTAGLCSLLMVHGGVRGSFGAELEHNEYLMKVLVAVPAIVGFALQYTMEGGKAKKKPKGDKAG